MRFGRHVPASPAMLKAVELGHQLGCETLQIFVSNPMGWKPSADNLVRDRAFAQVARENNLYPVIIHAPYLINLASPDKAVWEKSVHLLRWTLQRGTQIGAKSIVFHTGSHRQTDIQSGIERIAEGIKRLLGEDSGEVMLLLENDAGGGDSLGWKFEHLRDVLSLVSDYSHRVGICLDTAHLWGAGYNLSSFVSTRRVIQHFDTIVGANCLKVIHLNDTPVLCGSHRDIHERIGEGNIPLQGFQALLSDPLLEHCSVLLETPVKAGTDGKEDWEHERQHIIQVKTLARQPLIPEDGDEEISSDILFVEDKKQFVQSTLW
jgi:deoxyribonuclease IV